LVSNYDQVIDTGLKDYKEQINNFIKNTADKGGTKEGTYESNKTAYNFLETKIDLLIDRARMQSNGSCKLIPNLTQKIEKLLGDKTPLEISKQGQQDQGNSFGCTERLLVLVKKQLMSIKEIHQRADKCTSRTGEQLSCIRLTTSKTALDISNQSINAAWLVETTKRSSAKKIN
jgi:hypothetical protein